jgi:hypothetical protein
MDGRDLDALIGGLRQEAAARRAAPDFPLDDEAATALELDAHAPHGPGPDLAAIASRLQHIGARPEAEAGLAASAVRAADTRLTHLERRTARLVFPATTAGSPAPGDALADLDVQWMERTLIAQLPATGDVLVAGRDSARWAESAIRQAPPGGGEVRAVDPSLDAVGDSALRRGGPVLDVLRSHGPASLGLIVFTGPYGPAELGELEDAVAEAARVADGVLVLSASPWWWRRSGASPLPSATRPVEAEAWLEMLSGTGRAVRAEYGPGGRCYCVTARATEPS